MSASAPVNQAPPNVELSDPLFANPRIAVPRGEETLCALAIDAEEDFNWDTPVHGTPHSTDSMRNIRVLQTILDAYGVIPTYLLTYPVMADRHVVHTLRQLVERGKCDVGIQLHPWVTPPFESATGIKASFSGNLAPELEARKLETLARIFFECFGRYPLVYRAGRYGLGSRTAERLEEMGFTVDTSLAPRTDFSAEGGPDYRAFDYQPFWFGRTSQLLELPLCRSIVGWGGTLAPRIYQALTTRRLLPFHLSGPLTRSRCAERITLSPEGNDVQAMKRLVRRLRAAGQRIFILSFHSSSLAAGRNPYVQTKADLHYFYDRLSGILDFMAGQPGMRFVSLANIPQHLVPSPP